MRNFKGWDNVEGAAWSSLSLLATGRTKLGPLDLALLRRDLQTAKEMEVLSVLNSERQIARARAMGVSAGPSRPDYVQLVCHEGSA